MKIKSILAVAIAAMVTLASCNKNDDNNNVNNGKTTSVKLTIIKPEGTRSVAPGQAAQTVTLTTAKVYFTDASSNILSQYDITADGVHVFDGVNANFTNCHVVANLPAAAYPTTGAVTAKSVEVASFTKADGTLDNVVLYGTTASKTLVGDTYEVGKVQLKPIGSRIEIAQFTGQLSTNNATKLSYTLEGIYMNNVYTKMMINGVKTSATGDLTTYGTEADGNTPLIYKAGVGVYTAAGVLYDEPAAVAALGIAKPVSGVWAYNVLAPKDAAADYFPHIDIRFGTLDGNAGLGFLAVDKRYMTVTGFIKNDGSGTAVAFVPGKIYRIVDYVFDETNLDSKPEQVKVKAKVDVELINWEFEAVLPVH